MRQFKKITSLRRFLAAQKRLGKTVSLVPTMGALHAGHKSCIDIARRTGDLQVTSIFVNPTQFGPKEDFGAYPRREARDLRLLAEWGCDVAFLPSADEMYKSRQEVWVEVESLTGVLCGKKRPGHFRGVATVVAKLFNIVAPDIAVFGQKDAQQAIVIREMMRQLNFPIKILLSTIIREPDGLAVSSRNEYMSRDDRRIAPGIYKSLCCGRDLMESGERSSSMIVHAVKAELKEAGISEIEYAELVRVSDLKPIDPIRGRVLLAVAVRVGRTRLIDNMVFDVGEKVRESKLF